MLLKDVLSFDEMDNDNQQLLKDDGSKILRESFGVCCGRPVTLLDAANYVKEAWN